MRIASPLLTTLLLIAVTGSPVIGQASDGTPWSTAGGIALGGYSGAALGLLGTMMPCNRTMAGGRCAAVGAAAGGALGLALGGVVGARSEEEIRDRLRSAGWGAAAGAVVGVVLWRNVRQYAWNDAVAVAALGGALGAAPVGSGLGAAAGATTGAVAWWLLPDRGLPDFLMLTLVGAMVGGLVDWGVAAADEGYQPTPFYAVYSIPIG